MRSWSAFWSAAPDYLGRGGPRPILPLPPHRAGHQGLATFPPGQILTYRRGGPEHRLALCHERGHLIQADPLGGPAGGGRCHPVLFAGGVDLRVDLLGPAPRSGPAPEGVGEGRSSLRSRPGPPAIRPAREPPAPPFSASRSERAGRGALDSLRIRGCLWRQGL